MLCGCNTCRSGRLKLHLNCIMTINHLSLKMKVLITGGTGLIGTRLAEMLIDSGYEVALLSREPAKSSHYRSFRWDPRAGTIDEAAVPYADYIVNLAGASVADGKWTDERKRDIMTSRLGGLALLSRELAKPGHHVQAVYFGLGHWRFMAMPATSCSPRKRPRPAHPRLPGRCIAPVGAGRRARRGAGHPHGDSAHRHGAEHRRRRPAPDCPAREAGRGRGAGQRQAVHVLDSPRRPVPPVHCHAGRRRLAAAPTMRWPPTRSRTRHFTEELAEVLHRPLLLPKVPAFGLKLAMGEMSDIVLASQRVSAAKGAGAGLRV